MSINIGSIKIETPVFLAPMSGVSDLPFRRIVKRFGAGLVFSEMIASRAVLQGDCESLKANTDYSEEFPMAVQLAGCDPEAVAEAAKINVDRGAAIIDINFGCPVKKIVKKYAGSALMQDEVLATKIMAATVKAVNVPVTVKMRLGWDQNNLNAPRLAKIAQDLGVKMITVHGRTREQMYKGHANWQAIRRVANAISIPLIVNGDILNSVDAQKALTDSGADGLMVGRGACGKPWLLKEIMDQINGKTAAPPPEGKALINLIHSHYEEILEYYGPHKGVPIARKHLSWYSECHRNSAEFRKNINKERDPEVVKSMIDDFFIPHPPS